MHTALELNALEFLEFAYAYMFELVKYNLKSYLN